MNPELNICILSPVYNDWESFQLLISNIEKVKYLDNFKVEVIAINDGSTNGNGHEIKSNKFNLEILHLKTNVGHQRSIAIGLQYIADTKLDFSKLIVMDSDGDDKPEDIPELLIACERNENSKIILAQRKKRNENFLFKFSYFLYKKIFRLLTGFSINYGNFSCIPQNILVKLIYLENIWNHYAGSIMLSRIPYKTISLTRGKRYRGNSKMNTNSLIIHGLSAISIYFDTFTIRILKGTFFGIFIGLFFILIVLYQKLIAGTAIPGWASSLILIVSGIILQLFSVTLIVLLLQLSKRKSILPPDNLLYKEFIESIHIHKE
jgi:hypothetical protein